MNQQNDICATLRAKSAQHYRIRSRGAEHCPAMAWMVSVHASMLASGMVATVGEIEERFPFPDGVSRDQIRLRIDEALRSGALRRRGGALVAWTQAGVIDASDPRSTDMWSHGWPPRVSSAFDLAHALRGHVKSDRRGIEGLPA